MVSGYQERVILDKVHPGPPWAGVFTASVTCWVLAFPFHAGLKKVDMLFVASH